jgi:hypothetical protein
MFTDFSIVTKLSWPCREETDDASLLRRCQLYECQINISRTELKFHPDGNGIALFPIMRTNMSTTFDAGGCRSLALQASKLYSHYINILTSFYLGPARIENPRAGLPQWKM